MADEKQTNMDQGMGVKASARENQGNQGTGPEQGVSETSTNQTSPSAQGTISRQQDAGGETQEEE
ncbi:MAG TPA: hypothetical protein VGB17_05780 [Pyrinomonadaceae bacterium]|jgi:hypothetical protein